MNVDGDFKKRERTGMVLLILMAAVLILLLGASSCGTAKTATVTETERETATMATVRDTVRIFNVRTDSVTVRDSVFTQIKGDTVLIREYHLRDRWRERAADTVRLRADTVVLTKTVSERKSKTTEQGKSGLPAVLLVVAIGGALAWLIGRKH